MGGDGFVVGGEAEGGEVGVEEEDGGGGGLGGGAFGDAREVERGAQGLRGAGFGGDAGEEGGGGIVGVSEGGKNESGGEEQGRQGLKAHECLLEVVKTVAFTERGSMGFVRWVA